MALKTFFMDIASRGSLLMIEGEAYFASPGQCADHIEFTNSLVKLGLLPGGGLADLLRFYKGLRRNEIYAIKKEFIEGKVKEGFQVEEERKKEIGDKRLFLFIINELMPFMSGHKEDISELLGEEVRKQNVVLDNKEVDEMELLKTLEQVKKCLYKEQEEYRINQFGNAKDPLPFFCELTQGNILTLEDAVYHLEKPAEGGADIILHINGKNDSYRIVPFVKIDEIESKFSEFLQWAAKSEAIEEFSEYIREVQKIKLSTIKDFDKAMQLKEFNDGDIGFLRDNSYVYIYQIIPPFAMLDPRPTKKDVCYEFPRLRVGLQIQYSERHIHLGNPCLFEPEWHPFTEYEGKAFQHLCGGKIPERGKCSEVEWVAKALDDAKNLVMHGLTPKSIKEHDGDTTSGGRYFGTSLDQKLQPRIIKVEEVIKKGLLITNKWEWEKG